MLRNECYYNSGIFKDVSRSTILAAMVGKKQLKLNMINLLAT